MDRTCQKCNQPIPKEAFLCPHCGAILESVQLNPVETKSKKTKKVNYRHIFAVILALLLVAAAVLLIGSILKWVAPDGQDPTTQPTQPATTTPAPLVAYEVKVRTDKRDNLKGILVMVCKDGEVLYTCEAGDYGKATFILPQKDGYTIRLAQLPEPYHTLYCTSEYTFESGKQNLEIILEAKAVPYFVQVVNRQGEPIEGQPIQFRGTSEKMNAETDEMGRCVFEAPYFNAEDSGPEVYLRYFPSGYVAATNIFHFDPGSLQLTIVLDRYEELEIPDGQALYKVTVKNLLGQPMPNFMLSAISGYAPISGYTNLDGVFTFIGEKGRDYVMVFSKNADYSRLEFPFAPGETELEVTLPTEYTVERWPHEIRVVDQGGRPVPDAVFAYQSPDGTVEEFTSDSNGVIEMKLTETIGSVVTVQLVRWPQDYEPTQTEYQFTHSLEVIMTCTKKTQVTVRVVDQNGDPVPDVSITVIDYRDNEMLYSLGSEGVALLELDPTTYYVVWIHDCPAGYESYGAMLYITFKQTEYILEIVKTGEMPEE